MLAFGLVGGCDSGGGGKKRDASAEEDGGDTSPDPIVRDGGMDAGDDSDADEAPCMPTLGCDDLEGVECGRPLDDCDQPLDCGGDEKCVDPDDPSTEFFTCGGGGEEFKCGCKPKTCDDEGICGTLDDGCGGQIECGDECAGEYDTCGVVTANQCDCAPDLSACGTAQCGSAPDSCGGTVQCGSHGGGCSEARTCNAGKQCECKPAAELCADKCGTQNIDGCAVTCPTACPPTPCAAGASCANCTCEGAGAICANNACCTPDARATTCGTATCGTKVNNCGQTVTCGTCGGAAQCTQGQCVDPRLSAMAGTYAVRSVGFAYSDGQGSRSEGYALVNITLNGTQLVMREQACASLLYAKPASSEIQAAQILPAVAEKFPAIETVLDLSGTRNLPGAKEWFRDTPSAAQSTLGWRRGRPSYCPEPTAAVPQPVPSPALPGYNDPGGKGAKKPWLSGDCKCPEAEVAQPGHEACSAATTPASQRAACMADWINLSVPYQPGGASADSQVTDCRVIDEDGDGAPAVTINANAGVLARATLRSASVTANQFWGDIDESGARRHKGVVLDLPGIRNSVVSCIEPEGGWGLLGMALCRASTAKLCPAVRENGDRSSPVDFVPLDTLPAPNGGQWNCQKLFDARSSLFRDIPNFSNNYPPESLCSEPM